VRAWPRRASADSPLPPGRRPDRRRVRSPSACDAIQEFVARTDPTEAMRVE